MPLYLWAASVLVGCRSAPCSAGYGPQGPARAGGDGDHEIPHLLWSGSTFEYTFRNVISTITLIHRVAPHASRGLVLANPDEGRMPEQVIPGPLDERDLDDQTRRHPTQ